ncbi:hypothetical protein CKM354_001234200 [Cercospora kikuchii]|uniref:Uncharacterized protein n=1 Tax=Cercospora kikuchii TaxID=84275 RepID=A0A9P3FLT1_9PEZI|nr:uncharacterized protein CKM354_001234200 [Cercospora kikuchii]GIZ49310.1 hypothetical protein CKM354_001234200 [Cercospora kikuchii]
MSPNPVPQTIPWTRPDDPDDPHWELAPGWVPQHDDRGQWFYVSLAPPHERRTEPPKARPIVNKHGQLRPEVKYGKSWWADPETDDEPPVWRPGHRKTPTSAFGGAERFRDRGNIEWSRAVARVLETPPEKTLKNEEFPYFTNTRRETPSFPDAEKATTRSRAMRLNVLEQLTLRPQLFTHELRTDGSFGPIPANQITVTAETLRQQACRPLESPTGPMPPHLVHEEKLRREALGEQLQEEFRLFMRKAKKSYQQAAQRALDQQQL